MPDAEPATRRRHDAELKARVLEACVAPGTSVARPGAARPTRSPSSPPGRPPSPAISCSCACPSGSSPSSPPRSSLPNPWLLLPRSSLTAWAASLPCAARPSCTSPMSPAGGTSAGHLSLLAVNTLQGNLKTALAGTYHAFGREKYAHRYLARVQHWLNRRFDLRSILTGLARAASRATPCPMLAVRAAESAC
jgi:hypothetical protein